jgi:hypothetical protein
MPQPHQPPPPARDPLAELLFTAAGEAIGYWLEARGKLSQPIRSLEKHELMGMAWAAVSTYQHKRQELERQEAVERSVRPLPDAPLGM